MSIYLYWEVTISVDQKGNIAEKNLSKMIIL